VGVAVFSFRKDGITASEAGIPSVNTGNAFRMYVEGSKDGLVRTGFAIANPSGAATTAKLDLLNLDGSSAGLSGSVAVPAFGQRSLFLNEIQGFASLQLPFKGLVRITTSDAAKIAVVGIRGHLNERGDFLSAIILPIDDNSDRPPKWVFPEVVDGGGYTTQFVLYSSGVLEVHSQSGTGLNILNLK